MCVRKEEKTEMELSEMRMNPESTQCQSDVSSPAKKQRLNTLVNFWGGAEVKAQFMNNHASSTSTNKKISNLATTQNTEAHARQKSCSGDNPVGGGQGCKLSESGRTQLK